MHCEITHIIHFRLFWEVFINFILKHIILCIAELALVLSQFPQIVIHIYVTVSATRMDLENTLLFLPNNSLGFRILLFLIINLAIAMIVGLTVYAVVDVFMNAISVVKKLQIYVFFVKVG